MILRRYAPKLRPHAIRAVRWKRQNGHVQYDVAVAGLGGMGSAILAHCARRGVSAIGLEQFERGHDLGASSGKTHLFRKAYFEEPAYVPLLHQAYELWRELERDGREEILRLTGVLSVGEESSEILNRTLKAAREHDLPVELLSRRNVLARYPTLRIRDDEVAVFESDAGVLKPERAIAAHLQVAAAHGAEMRFCAGIRDWSTHHDGFEIHLADGARVSARALILALGPWFKHTLESLGVPIRVQRNVQAWFTPAMRAYDAARFPGFLVDRRELPAPLYGFPDFGDGVKVAFHGFGELTDAEHFDRAVDLARDIEPLARFMEEWMPGAADTFLEAKPCMYTLTPDEHFVIDRHPEHAKLILCGGFSGHGFKFASVIGEIAADLALDGGSRHPISFLSLGRFAASERN
ncbi:MAG: N-methyl-L-tryptophan oxidase [Chthoniobacterales bacterium]|nr:N-methyl-L-tryptophan oxidase [Chthoniobacterales bacterium]